MRRRRIKRKSLGVSLFPFLAVLICTLGVLIILLVLAVRSADLNAAQDQIDVQQQQQQQQARLDELSFEQDRRLVEIEGLTLTRPDLLHRLTGAREHRGHLEAEIRKLKSQATELGRSLLALQQDIPEMSNAATSDAQVVELKRQILLAQQELEAVRTESRNNASVTYSIVPHAGNGGTFRRPIFIECTSDAIVIQPLGIRLLKSEFAPPLEPGNMLDAALLAIREYWQKYDLERTAGSPYPLLVVRPDGAETYVLARHAMKSWEDEFGYELVEADKKLDFGVPDEALKKQIESVIHEAKIRQQHALADRAAQQRAIANRRSQGPGRVSDSRASAQRPGLTASGPNGGFVASSDWQRVATGGDFSEPDLGVSQTGGQQLDGDSDNNEFVGSDSKSPTESDLAAEGTGKSGPQSNGNQTSTDAATASTYQSMSLAKNRGKNWALPTQSDTATGYVRPIRVVCSADELEVRSALGVEKRIPITDDFAQCVDPLINEIWRQIESWGLSGERSYWKPELRISVIGGGELNFEKLRGVLHDSGVDVKESQP